MKDDLTDHGTLLDHLWDDHKGMDEVGYDVPLEELEELHKLSHAGEFLHPPGHTHE